MLELIIGSCVICLLLYFCNRKGGFFYNKRRIESIMNRLPVMIEEVDACEIGKFISYRYRNEKNDKFIVTCFIVF